VEDTKKKPVVSTEMVGDEASRKAELKTVWFLRVDGRIFAKIVYRFGQGRGLAVLVGDRRSTVQSGDFAEALRRAREMAGLQSAPKAARSKEKRP
jgi:hypothetical protein